MLPKKHRLTFDQYLHNTNPEIKHFSDSINLSYKKNNTGACRFVILVPKYTDKRSVYRHKTKRIIAGVIQKNISSLSGGLDVMIKARRIITGSRQIASVEEFLKIFRKDNLK